MESPYKGAGPLWGLHPVTPALPLSTIPLGGRLPHRTFGGALVSCLQHGEDGHMHPNSGIFHHGFIFHLCIPHSSSSFQGCKLKQIEDAGHQCPPAVDALF